MTASYDAVLFDLDGVLTTGDFTGLLGLSRLAALACLEARTSHVARNYA